MHTRFLSLLQSPDDGSTLSLSTARVDGDDVLEGTLTDQSGRLYPIEDGIPRLLPASLLPAQKSEITARDAQVDDYDKMAFLNLFGKVEIPLTRLALALRPSDLLLEAGCGTGRMTPTWAQASGELVALDFSFESVRVCRRKLLAQGLKHVHLAQADLCALPLKNSTFDRVVSCQVLEHVPGPDARRRAVQNLARVARPGAVLALSAYKHSLFTRAFAQKEGEHDGGIPFFRFTARELRETLAESFDVQRVSGVLVYLYLAACVKRKE